MSVRTRIQPFLLFEGKAEEALRFYVSLFPESEIREVVRWGADGPGADGTIRKATFSIAGQNVMCTDSVVRHAFTFTPAVSFFVTCATEEELRRVAAALLQGGRELMPLDNYGFSRLFTWVNDRYGVSWQLNLD